MKKLLNLFNVKNWVETFLMKTVVNKAVKHAVTVIIGLIGGAKVQPLLTQFGVTIDPAVLQAQLTVFFGGAAGWLVNWGISVLDKDGDGKIG